MYARFRNCRPTRQHVICSRVWIQLLHQSIQGGYVRIYLKFTILKNYMHRARAALARALAPRAKVGVMSQT